MLSRREFTRIAVVSARASRSRELGAQTAPREAATVRGVKLGAITGVYGPFTPAAGQDVVDVVIARTIEAGIGHVELVNTSVRTSGRRRWRGRTSARDSESGIPADARSAPPMATDRAARSIPRDPPEVRRRGGRSVLVRHDDRRRFHGSRDRCRLQADGCARSHEVLHEPDARRNGIRAWSLPRRSTGSVRRSTRTTW